MAEFFRLTASDQDATWPFKMDKTRNYDENRLATGIKLANAAHLRARRARDPNYRGMGTTIVTVHFADGGGLRRSRRRQPGLPLPRAAS